MISGQNYHRTEPQRTDERDKGLGWLQNESFKAEDAVIVQQKQQLKVDSTR